MKIKRFECDGRLSRAVIYNGVLYISGLTVSDTEGIDADIKGQTQIVLDKIERVLLQYGSGKDKLLSATIYLKDISMKNDMDSVWKMWVSAGKEPARTTVEAALSDDKKLIEISMIAAV